MLTSQQSPKVNDNGNNSNSQKSDSHCVLGTSLGTECAVSHLICKTTLFVRDHLLHFMHAELRQRKEKRFAQSHTTGKQQN